jgi:hypothetical protein
VTSQINRFDRIVGGSLLPNACDLPVSKRVQSQPRSPLLIKSLWTPCTTSGMPGAAPLFVLENIDDVSIAAPARLRNLSIQVLSMFARAFGITLSELLAGVEDRAQGPSRVKRASQPAAGKERRGIVDES